MAERSQSGDRRMGIPGVGPETEAATVRFTLDGRRQVVTRWWEHRGDGIDVVMLAATNESVTELNRAAVALARDQRGEAARLFEIGKRELDDLGAALDPDDQFEFDWLRAQLAK